MPTNRYDSTRSGNAIVAALAVAVLCAAVATGSALAQQPAPSAGYADEDRDWGVPPTTRLRHEPYHAPTPRTIPGASVVGTRELQAMLAGPNPPILVDVLSEEGHVSLAGAVWIAGAGRGGDVADALQSQLVPLLAQVSGGDKARPLAFFCASSQCWLSYNTALRAVAAGYTRVYWYRGGIDAWTEADLPTAKTMAVRKP